MSTLRAVLGLLAICAVVIVLSVLGLASDLLSRLLTNVDGLLLLMICLMMGVLFAFMIYVLVKEAKPSPAPVAKVSAAARVPQSAAPANPVAPKTAGNVAAPSE